MDLLMATKKINSTGSIWVQELLAPHPGLIPQVLIHLWEGNQPPVFLQSCQEVNPAKIVEQRSLQSFGWCLEINTAWLWSWKQQILEALILPKGMNFNTQQKQHLM